MSLPKKTDTALYKNDSKYIDATAHQIIKDFAIEGFQIAFSESKEQPYQQLFSQVFPVVEMLLNNKPTKLQQLLYRIDLPEKTFKHILHVSPEPASELTELIIQRELLKVVIRFNYSSK
jgi:hypothetical protein